MVAPCRILYALLATLAAFQGCLPAAALTYSGVPRPAPFERREERRRLALIKIFLVGCLQENVKERGIRVVQCMRGRSGDVVCCSVGQAGQGVQGRTLVPSVGTAMGTAATTTGESTAVRAYIYIQLLKKPLRRLKLPQVGRVIEK